MQLATKILDRFRKRLVKLIEAERKVTGCAKSAIARISKKIQMSPASIYRVVNGYGDVQVKAHQYMALIMVVMGTSAAKARFCNAAKSVGAKFSMRRRRIFSGENLVAP